MQFHSIKRKTKNKKRMLVARGGKRGKTAGRGTKGQRARSGRKIRPEIRDVIKRIPKLRGRGKNSNLSIQTKPLVINIEALEKAFKAGETVTPATIVAKGILTAPKTNAFKVKVLGNGELTKKLTFKGVLISGSVKEKIEKSGSTFE